MTITTHQDFDTGDWHLYATSHSRTAIAGPRLFRGYPRPDIRFRHSTKEAAEKDAAALQEYLNTPPSKSRAAARKQGAFGDVDDPVWAVGL